MHRVRDTWQSSWFSESLLGKTHHRLSHVYESVKFVTFVTISIENDTSPKSPWTRIFLGTNLNYILISNWICTARYREITHRLCVVTSDQTFTTHDWWGTSVNTWLVKIISLFCKRALWKRRYSVMSSSLMSLISHVWWQSHHHWCSSVKL